ncbi:MAG TPA: 23S rRNA (uracil(1939)-C(5))-methyltransferase RlmD [Planctomycetota bacterium]|nr:23S rRNA (uracil(1939)-C(5))-methyltransferase RlmD [Planctomycetota bacterium]
MEEAGVARRAPASLFPTPGDLCPHFGPCGGCSLLDRGYAEQLRSKRAAVERALAEVFRGEPVEVAPVLPDPHPYHYRNKAIYPLRGLRKGGRREVVAGFFRRGSHALVDVRRCDIQEPALTQVANRLRDAIESSRVPVYDERTGEGTLRHLFLRCSPATGEMMAAFVTAEGPFPDGHRLAGAAKEAGNGLRTGRGRAIRVVSVLRNLNPGRGNTILGPRTVRLLGRPYLFDRLADLRLRVSLTAFVQVNARMAERTYALVRELAGDRVRGRVVDAYSGIGSLSLFLAREAGEVLGIEENAAAASDAEWNARSNRLGNARFLAGRVEERLGETRGPVDLLVLDPPRAGCADGALEAASRLRPGALVYVSCNPVSLARDLGRLLRDFALLAVRPVDLFPQTEHVEVVTLLEPRAR